MGNGPYYYIQSEVTGEWIEVDKETFNYFIFPSEIKMDEVIYGRCSRNMDKLLKQMGI